MQRLVACVLAFLVAAAVLPARPAWARGCAVPVVMYHQIGDGPNSLWLEEKRFAEQVRWLAENGYRAVTFSEACDYVRGVKEPPQGVRPVALTFDDGYGSFYAKAAPLLRRYGFRATVFIITDQVGKGDHVTWKQLEELVAEGFEVGSHTRSHPDLTRVSRKRLSQEIAGSKELIEKSSACPSASSAARRGGTAAPLSGPCGRRGMPGR